MNYSLVPYTLNSKPTDIFVQTLDPETSVLAKDDADPLKLIPVSKLWLSVIRILHPAAISPKSLTLTFPKALDPTR